MITLLLPFLAAFASEPADVDVPDAHHRQVVFAEIPDKKQRLKLIRKAYRTSRTLHGGRDWGRVVCFVYAGPVEPGSLEKALRKAGLEGTIREAESCSTPPAEAYIPPGPKAVRRVTLFEPMEPIIVRKAFAYVLTTDVGVSGLHVAPAKSDRLCLELEREVPDAQLEALLSTAPIRVIDLAAAENCVDALGLSPRR